MARPSFHSSGLSYVGYFETGQSPFINLFLFINFMILRVFSVITRKRPKWKCGPSSCEIIPSNVRRTTINSVLCVTDNCYIYCYLPVECKCVSLQVKWPWYREKRPIKKHQITHFILLLETMSNKRRGQLVDVNSNTTADDWRSLNAEASKGTSDSSGWSNV